jgi:hypothetical protein
MNNAAGAGLSLEQQIAWLKNENDRLRAENLNLARRAKAGHVVSDGYDRARAINRALLEALRLAQMGDDDEGEL